MNPKEICHIYGPRLTPKTAKGLVLEFIERELSSYFQGEVSIGDSPSDNPNHEYWKMKLSDKVKFFENANHTGEKVGGKIIYTSNLNTFLALEYRARSGEITFREAYTRILVLDHTRNALLKERINTEYCSDESHSETK